MSILRLYGQIRYASLHSSSNLIIFQTLIRDCWVWRRWKNKEWRQKKKRSHHRHLWLWPFTAQSVHFIIPHSNSALIRNNGLLWHVEFFTHRHTHGHKCTFPGLWLLLVWHWQWEWHHKAGHGKHPWLVDSWDSQESGCQCWWSTFSCCSPAQWRVKRKSTIHSLLRLNKHVLDCWDWLEHLGLLCLFEQRQLTSQILSKRQPCLVELDMNHKYTLESCLDCKVKHALGCVQSCCKYCKCVCVCVWADYISVLGGSLEETGLSAFCNSVKYYCVVIFTSLSRSSLVCWMKARGGVTYSTQQWSDERCSVNQRACKPAHLTFIFTVTFTVNMDNA